MKSRNLTAYCPFCERKRAVKTEHVPSVSGISMRLICVECGLDVEEMRRALRAYFAEE